MGLMYALFGLVIGFIMMLIALIAGAPGAGMMGLAFGVAAPIFLAVGYGLMGWIGGYITAWIYNIVAKRTGGIQFEFEQ